ncbi:cytochrome c oxidase assembly protein [Cerasicoccus arenae]|uniref:Cytochrome c oxidase assembly factor CtaG n=1 Tax=Cerasicoccus arenae TaxID=424488 RepID=A0A8J3GDU1_9BACT|nr:cytochrome c oxidase assembly protein [Cerasicoccus arenae]MBK1858676.1 cytochrome c oxidase assembly protein [Cerasicoccus arenae]GHB98255.1 cytochrome c oxidase assembly factor CtaG [Cerasicoccus arenae]
MPIPLHWHTEPFLLLLIIGAGWLYALATGPWRDRIAPGERFPMRQSIWFYLGLGAGYLTVGSPLDQWGESFLFSAHMVQHMLLIYLVPPLLIRGLPTWLADWLLAPAIIRKPIKVLVNPFTAWLTFTFLYTLWHIPSLYELALQQKDVHVLEHWCMFIPALMMWWPIISPSTRVPPIGYGPRMLYLFLLMIGQLPVFGFLTLSETVLYPTYEWAPRVIDLDPLQDQILGGLIMKVVNMGVSLSLLAWCFYAWHRQDTAEAEA